MIFAADQLNDNNVFIIIGFLLKNFFFSKPYPMTYKIKGFEEHCAYIVLFFKFKQFCKFWKFFSFENILQVFKILIFAMGCNISN